MNSYSSCLTPLIRKNSEKERFTWLTTGGIVHHGEEDTVLEAWSSWSHCMCGLESENGECWGSTHFLLFIEFKAREWCHLQSRWVWSPQVNNIESALKDPPDMCLLGHSKPSRVDNDDEPSYTHIINFSYRTVLHPKLLVISIASYYLSH